MIACWVGQQTSAGFGNRKVLTLLVDRRGHNHVLVEVSSWSLGLSAVEVLLHALFYNFVILGVRVEEAVFARWVLLLADDAH